MTFVYKIFFLIRLWEIVFIILCTFFFFFLFVLKALFKKKNKNNCKYECRNRGWKSLSTELRSWLQEPSSQTIAQKS